MNVFDEPTSDGTTKEPGTSEGAASSAGETYATGEQRNDAEQTATHSQSEQGDEAQRQEEDALPARAVAVALAGWLVPGLGHAMLQMWGRAVAICLTVGFLVYLGAGMRGNLFVPGGEDAFSRLGRTDAGTRIVDCFRENAPTWLAQMPALVPPSERIHLQTQALGTTRERMLREMADALEALTKDKPLMLVLEDLHWSDFSTIDLISYLARRRDPARLMIVGTYRPVEAILDEHPVKSVKREQPSH